MAKEVFNSSSGWTLLIANAKALATSLLYSAYVYHQETIKLSFSITDNNQVVRAKFNITKNDMTATQSEQNDSDGFDYIYAEFEDLTLDFFNSQYTKLGQRVTATLEIFENGADEAKHSLSFDQEKHVLSGLE